MIAAVVAIACAALEVGVSADLPGDWREDKYTLSPIRTTGSVMTSTLSLLSEPLAL